MLSSNFSGILMMLGVYLILILLIRLVDLLNKKKTNFKTLILSIIIIPAIIGATIGFALIEYKQLNYTIDKKGFFKLYIVIGLILGISILTYKYFKGKAKGINIINFALYIFIFPILFVSLSSFINRIGIKSDVIKENGIILKKIKQEKEEQNIYWLIISYNLKKEKFSIEEDEWNSFEENDNIIIEIQKGRLGYDLIKNIYLKNQLPTTVHRQ